MDAFDQTPPPNHAKAQRTHQDDPETIALWFALDADRRARDERTERLRAMRLTSGEDDGA